MYSVYRFYIFSIVFLIIFSMVFVYSSSYNYVVDRKIFMNGSIDVVYRASFERSRVLIKIYNVDYNDPVVLSMFIWMSNGSVVEIGRTFFKGSYGEIDYKYLSNVYDEWNRHLKEIGARPGSIDIGLIILGTIHKRDGVYTLATAVPLNPEHISKRLGIEITINKELEKTLSIEELSRVFEQFMGFGNANVLESIRKTNFINLSSSSWPPDVIPEGLFFAWVKIDQKIANGVTTVPLLALAVNGGWDRIYFVNLREILKASRSQSVRVVSTIGAAIGDIYSESFNYKVLGFSWTANDETAANIDYLKTFYPGRNFNGESILYVGFIADLAYVLYRLYLCAFDPISFIRVCVYPTGTYANTTMVRPVNGGPLTNNIVVSGVASLHDNNNPITQVYRGMLNDGWFQGPYKYASTQIWVDTANVASEENTLEILTLSLDVIGLLRSAGVLGTVLTFLGKIVKPVSSVGVEAYSSSSLLQYGVVQVVLRDYYDWAYYQYAKSPDKYEYNGVYYTVTMLFVDAWIDVPSKPYNRS